MSLNLVIKKTGVSGASRELSIDVDPSATVAELKEQISAGVELPSQNIRLVCAGRVWDNVATIASYNPGAGSIIHCLNNPTRAVPESAAQTLSVANPMQQMMASAMPPPTNSSDPFEQMQAQVQQQMAQNPEMMQQMMNSPMMQQMMSNPETLRGMMRMNPRMNQLMEQRPEIARMLEDPELMQQSMRMMANPELMREMTRNQDRAMGQLNVMPGGHQALVNAHADLMDPLHAAMSGGNAASGTAQPTYDDAVAAPNNEALPNPWGGPPASTPAPAPTATMPATPTWSAPPPASAATAVPPLASAFGQQGAQPDPMQQMMQQMMSNPAMMQHAMGMTQQMMQPQANAQGNAAPFSGFGGGAGGFGSPGANPFQMMMQQQMNTGAAQSPPVSESVQRVQFASQLMQLANMGFTDESMCLRALTQHNGRLDSAIDVLLTGTVD